MADPYKLRKADGYVVECDRCSSPAPTVERDWDDIGTPPEQIPHDRAPKERLCLFCYETHLGTLLKYRHHREDADLARAIAQALNLVLARVGRGAKNG